DKYWQLYLLLFLSTCILNTIFLLNLSLLLPPQTGWTDFWTYVQETRYYAPSMLFMVIVFFYFAVEGDFGPRWVFINKMILVSIFIYAFSYLSYRSVGIVLLRKDHYNIPHLYQDLWEVNAVIQPFIKDQKTIFVSHPSRELSFARFSGASIMDLESLKKSEFRTTKPITLLLFIPKNAEPETLKLLETQKAEWKHSFPQHDLYTLFLNP
ncbi:MAG: hypothetical protein AAFU64_20975, partial [Bacteroidota bacterium]